MTHHHPYRALATFVAVVDAGSIAGAARRLGVTPSAASHLLLELEKRMGVRLFMPGSKAALSAAGLQLRQSLGGALATIERAMTREGDARERVTVSTVSTFARLWMLPRLHSFQSRHPDVEVLLSATRRVVRLDDEPFDCAIRWGLGDWSGGESTLLFRERLALFGHPNGPAVGSLRLRRIAASSRPDDWRRFAEGVGVELDPPMSLVCDDRATALRAVEAGLGCTVIDETLAGPAVAAGRVQAPASGFRAAHGRLLHGRAGGGQPQHGGRQVHGLAA